MVNRIVQWTGQFAENADNRADYLAQTNRLNAAHWYKARSYQISGIGSGDSVMDLGCGVGSDAEALASLVAADGRLMCVDTSEDMIRKTKERVGHLTNVSFRVADGHCLPFLPQSFDVVRCDRLIQHVEDPDRVIDSIRRVLKPGGRVLLADPDWSSARLGNVSSVTNNVMQRHLCARVRNPNVASEGTEILRIAGFVDIREERIFLSFFEYDSFEKIFRSMDIVKDLSVNIGDGELVDTIQEIEHCSTDPQFYFNLQMVLTVASRPPPGESTVGIDRILALFRLVVVSSHSYQSALEQAYRISFESHRKFNLPLPLTLDQNLVLRGLLKDSRDDSATQVMVMDRRTGEALMRFRLLEGINSPIFTSGICADDDTVEVSRLALKDGLTRTEREELMVLAFAAAKTICKGRFTNVVWSSWRTDRLIDLYREAGAVRIGEYRNPDYLHAWLSPLFCWAVWEDRDPDNDFQRRVNDLCERLTLDVWY